MRKIKLNPHDFYNYLSSIGNTFYDDPRMSVVDKGTGRRVYGTLFKLSKPLRYEEKLFLDSFANTIIMVSQAQYAPELKSSCVWIGDVCLASKKAKLAQNKQTQVMSLG